MNDRLKRDAESAISDLISEIERLEEREANLEEQIRKLEKENEDLQDTIAYQDERLDEIESELCQARAEIPKDGNSEDYKLY